MGDLRVNRSAVALLASALLLGCATATETQVHGTGGTLGSGGFSGSPSGGTSSGGSPQTGGTSSGGTSSGGTSSGGSSGAGLGGAGGTGGTGGTTGGTGGTTGGTGGTTGGTGGTTGGTGGTTGGTGGTTGGTGGATGGTGGTTGGTGGTTGGTGGATGGTGGTTGGTGGTTGGAGGVTGTGGTTATGGSGGAATGCAASATLQVGFAQRSTNAAQISFDLFVRPSAQVQLSQIAVQYYFSNEEDSTLTVSVNSSDVNGGTCGSGPSGYQSVATKAQIIDDPNSTNPADKILEFTNTASGTITSGDCYFIRVEVQPSNYTAPNQDQTNDYSYSTQTSGAAWDHVTATVGGTLAWGCTP